MPITYKKDGFSPAATKKPYSVASRSKVRRVALLLQAINHTRSSSANENPKVRKVSEALSPTKLDGLLNYRFDKSSDRMEEKLSGFDSHKKSTSSENSPHKALIERLDLTSKKDESLKNDQQLIFFMFKSKSKFKKILENLAAKQESPNKSPILSVPQQTEATNDAKKASSKAYKLLSPAPLRSKTCSPALNNVSTPKQSYRISQAIDGILLPTSQLNSDQCKKKVSLTYNMRCPEMKTAYKRSEYPDSHEKSLKPDFKITSNVNPKSRPLGFFMQKNEVSEEQDKSSLKPSMNSLINKLEYQQHSAFNNNAKAVTEYGNIICRRAHLTIQTTIAPLRRIQSESKKDFLKKVVHFVSKLKSLGIPLNQVREFPMMPYQHPKAAVFIEASKYGNTEKIVEMTKEVSNLLVYEFDRCHQSTLHWALQNGHTECAHKLIDLGADINATDLFGRTPLFYAVAMLDTQLVLHLLLKGAIPWSTKSFSYISLSKNKWEILSLLKKFRTLAAVLEFQPKKNRESLKKFFLNHYLPNIKLDRKY